MWLETAPLASSSLFLGLKQINWSYSEAAEGLSEVVNNIHPKDLISLQGGSVKTYNYYQMTNGNQLKIKT